MDYSDPQILYRISQSNGFPHPERNGERGSKFSYPEWLIMFIAILSVKCKVKNYLGIHKLSTQYWDSIAADLNLPAAHLGVAVA